MGLVFFCFFFHILFTLRTLQNSLVEALCSWKSCFLVEKAKAEEGLVKKKETKGKQVQRRKKENHSGQDKKNSFVKATSIGGASRWRPDFGQRSRLKL